MKWKMWLLHSFCESMMISLGTSLGFLYLSVSGRVG